MTATTTANPLDDMVANPVQPRQDSVFFGQVVTIDPSAWKLVKGAGRQPFDEVHDDPKDRVRAIKIEIECEKRDGSHYIVDTGRQPLLEIDKAWHRYTLPSLQKLGVPLSQLKGKWVQVRRADTGETYVDRNGETKSRTALTLVAAYDTYEAMTAAREALFGRDRTQPSAPATAPAPASAPTVDKAALEKLLPALWKASGGNPAVFTTMFQSNPTLAAAFTLDDALALAQLG